MKRILMRMSAFCVSLTLFSGLFGNVALAKSLIDNFESYTDSSGAVLPDGWTKANTYITISESGTHQVRSAVEDNGNRYLSYTGKADRQGELSLSKQVSGISGKNWCVSFRFRTTNTSTDELFFRYFTESSSSTGSGIYIKGDGNFGGLGNNTSSQNALVAATGGVRSKVKTDTWQNITLVSYSYSDATITDEQRLALYVDGVFGGYRKASDIGAGGALTSIHCALSAGSSAKLIDITSGFDDIYTYSFDTLCLTGSGITNGAENIDPQSELKLVFSNPVSPSVLDKITFASGTETIPATTVFGEDMTTLIITPSVPLTSSSNYTISVADGVTDLAGTPFAAQNISFSTKAFTGISVSDPEIESSAVGASASFTVSNQTGEELNALAFVALYTTDGRIADVKVHKIAQLASGSHEDIALRVNAEEGTHDYTLKALLWDFHLRPLYAKSAALDTRPTLFIAGDSIAQSSSNTPKSGWVQHLNEFFTDDLNIVNRAIGGQSSRTYYSVPNSLTSNITPWEYLLSCTKPGDYVAIQFGHNDTNTAANKDTDPTLAIDVDPSTGQHSYKWYLAQFINEARAKGVNPILVSSVGRHITTGRYNPRPFGEYADAMVAVGEALNVPVLNINEETCKMFEEYGRVNDKVFFLILEQGAFTNWPSGYTDNQHLRDYGGIYVSYLFRQELAKTNSPLKAYMRDKYTDEKRLFLYDRFRDDITPEERGDILMLPASAVFEGLKATNISEAVNTISADYNETHFVATVGSTSYTAGSETKTASYAPEIINGKIYVPAMFFKDICGADVYINEFMKLVTVLTGIDTAPQTFIDGFDGFVGSATESITPTGWKCQQGFVADKAYIIGNTEEGNSYAVVTRVDAPSNSYYLYREDFEFMDAKDITMRVKTSEVQNNKDIKFRLREGSGSVYVIGTRFKGGYIQGPNGITAYQQTLSPNTWYTIKFKVLIVNDPDVPPTTRVASYITAIGDEELATPQFLGEYDVPDATGILQGIRFEISGTDTQFAIDDIKISEYEF